MEWMNKDRGRAQILAKNSCSLPSLTSVWPFTVIFCSSWRVDNLTFPLIHCTTLHQISGKQESQQILCPSNWIKSSKVEEVRWNKNKKRWTPFFLAGCVQTRPKNCRFFIYYPSAFGEASLLLFVVEKASQR